MKRQKNRANNELKYNNSANSKGTTFVISKNHTNAPSRKKRLSPLIKAKTEASKISLWKKNGMPDRVKSLKTKFLMAKIVREPGLGLSNPLEMN